MARRATKTRSQSIVNHGPVDQQLNIAGDATINQLLQQPRQIGQPRKSNLPLQNIGFVGRSVELEQIHALLAPGVPFALGQRDARRASLTGLGGVGKTQLSIEYAHRYADSYGHLLWVDAEGAGLEASFASLADDPLALGLDDATSLKGRIRAVKARLEEPSDKPHLLILDNVDEARAWSSWVPNSNTCVLLTTRLPHLAQVRPLTLGVLDEAGALELLLGERLAPENTPPKALTLCALLGNLPLAIYVAGRLLSERVWTIEELAVRIDRDSLGWSEHVRFDDLFKQRPSLRRLFEASVQRLSERDLVEAHALRLLWAGGWFAPVPIPTAVLLDAGARLAGTKVDEDLARGALARLVGVGLVGLDQSGRPTFHRLIGSFARAYGEMRAGAMVISALAQVCRGPDLGDLYRVAHIALSEHMSMALAHSDLGTPEERTAIGLWLQRYYLYHADYSHAIALVDQMLGTEPGRATAAVLANLGSTLREMGRGEQALEILHRAKALLEAQPSPDDIEYAAVCGSIGGSLLDLRRTSEASPYIREAAEVIRGAADAPLNLQATLLHERGRWLLAQGEYGMAMESLNRSLELRSAMGAKSEVGQAVTYHVIGLVLFEQGRFEDARLFFQRSFGIKVESLRAKHPYFAHDQSAIGQCFVREGNLKEAQRYLQAALEIYEVVLPAHQPEHDATLMDLGGVCRDLGMYDEAIGHSKRLILQRSEHQEQAEALAIAWREIGHVYLRKRDFVQAMRSYEEALSIQQRILPRTHYSIGITIGSMGQTLRLLGQHGLALSRLRQASRILQPSLPRSRKDLLLYEFEAGQCLLDQGDVKGLRQMGRAIERLEALLGVDAPLVRSCRSTMGIALLIQPKKT